MIGNLALFVVWPLTVVILFLRTSIPVALSVSIIGGYLLLPTVMTLNLPIIPNLNKDSIPVMMAGLCLLLGLARPLPDGPALPGLLPGSRIGMILVALLFAAPVMTTFTNGDRLVYGPRVIPGLGLIDVALALKSTAVTVLPLLLARKYLHNPEHHRTLVIVFAVAGLLYSLPALYEVRMSPRLNATIYGFFPHSWGQHLRGDGYRPLVFLQHGLWLGVFFACALIALVGWYRIKTGAPGRGKLLFAILWMAATLVLSKTLGALMLAIVLVPIVLFMPLRLQTLWAAVLAGIVLLYPVLRQADVLPVQWVADTVRLYEPSRAASLQYRLNNEDILLERARDRFLFGWGTWGRPRVYDPETGRDISTTDGRWVIILGQGGMAGYVGNFGLFAIPVILLFLRTRRTGAVTQATSTLGLMMVVNLIDMLLNGTETVLTWLMAGALLGHVEQRAPATAPPPVATAPPEGAMARLAPSAGPRPPGSQPVYTRQITRHTRKAASDT